MIGLIYSVIVLEFVDYGAMWIDCRDENCRKFCEQKDACASDAHGHN